MVHRDLTKCDPYGGAGGHVRADVCGVFFTLSVGWLTPIFGTGHATALAAVGLFHPVTTVVTLCFH
jgi:hypothetical protein